MIKIAFQMELLEKTNREENHTLALMNEACQRGHETYHFEPKDVALLNGKVIASVRRMSVDLGEQEYYKYGDVQEIDLADLDVIMFRQDPPVDMEYLTNTYLLEMLEGKVLVVNNPYWIRNATDKLYPFDFPELMPETLVTSDIRRIEEFKNQHKDIVVKPLYGFHGYGILRFEEFEKLNLTTQETFIIQPFIPEIKRGNKRVIFIDGEISGAIITRPEDGEFKVYRNSVDLPYELNNRDLEICNMVRKEFKKRGLVFVGIDIIGDYLIEINLGSVGSIRRFNEIYGRKIEGEILDAIERKL